MTRAALTGVTSDLASRFMAGESITMVARYSAPHGRRAREAAVQDLLGAAEALAHLGVDIRPALPSREQMQDDLRSATPTRSVAQDGRTFSNRFVTYDLRAHHGVYVVLSAGSGRKLDDTAAQPFVTYVAQVLRSTQSCMLFARRMDRITRKAWALAPVMLYLGERSGYIGDHRYGVRTASGVDSILTFFSAQTSEDDAEKLPTQTRDGMRARTGTVMEPHGCIFAVAHPSPPGFMSYRSQVNGSLGPRVLTFDTPACWPEPDQVAVGLPEVKDASGERPVDQVANVRWILARLGKPEWPSQRIAESLWRRRYSTEGLRRTHGPGAVLNYDRAVHHTAHAVVRSIMVNLDLYETGVFHIDFGIEGQPSIQIAGCIPPDGPWASPADFKRLRRWMLHKVSRPQQGGLALAGLVATVDGKECILHSENHCYDERPRMLVPYLVGPYRADGKRESPSDIPFRFDPQLLHDAIAEAIASTEGVGLELIADDPDELELLAVAELTQARALVQVLIDEGNALRAQVAACGEDGLPLIGGALLREINNRFEALDTELIPSARQEVNRLEATIADGRVARAKQQHAVAVEQLLGFVAALRDPANFTYRELLLTSICGVEIRTHERSCNSVFPAATVSFVLTIGDVKRTATLPVRCDLPEMTRLGVRTPINVLIGQLCSGERMLGTEGEVDNRRAQVRHLKKELGIKGRRLLLQGMTDPRLARLAALVLFDPRPLSELAEATGESEELLERIRHVHRNATTGVWWQTYNRSAVAACFDYGVEGRLVTKDDFVPAFKTGLYEVVKAIGKFPWADQWERVEGGLRLRPCARCEHANRRPLMIPEPDGLVCLGCRTDRAGHQWPADPYDRFLLPHVVPSD